MKGSIKRIMLVSLCAMMMLSLFIGVGEEKAMAARKYVTDEFLITSWISYYDTDITSYEEQTADLARSGMNFVMHPNIDSSCTTSGWTSGFTNERLKYVNSVMTENSMYYTVDKSSDWDTVVTDILIDDEDYKNIKFYYVVDEPSAVDFEKYAEQCKHLQEVDPSRGQMVNLYPSYAGTKALGGTYEEYLRNWVNLVGAENTEYLGFDHYPFLEALPENSYRNTYFSDLETVRKVAYQNGKMKTIGCTQLGSWNGMRRPTADMARANINTHLAYGMKSLIHFNWVAPEYRAVEDGGEAMMPAVLTSDGQKTDLYEPLQIMNWQTRQLGQILMKVDAQHAYHTGKIPTDVESLPKNYFFRNSSASDNLIITQFVGKNEEETYIMVVNKDMVNSVTPSFTVDMSFGISGLTQYIPDSFEVLPEVGKDLPPLTEKAVTLNDGKFSEEIEPGGLRLYKIEGDFKVPEAVQSPEVSLLSGSYYQKQTIKLLGSQPNVDYFYTTDGSFPVPYKGTTQKYSAIDYITLGEDNACKYYNLRVVGSRGGEVSIPVDNYYLVDTTGNKGKNLVGLSKSDFTINGGATTWEFTASAIKMTGAYSSIETNRGITYNKQKYKNFIVDITVEYGSGLGAHPGVGFYKKETSTSVWNNDGYYAILEHAGRVGVYDGKTEYGPRNIGASNFNVAGENNMRLLVVDDMIAISVNGKSCYVIKNPEIEATEGYVAYLAAHMPVTIKSWYIKPITEENIVGRANFPIEAINTQAKDIQSTVEIYTEKQNVVEALPTSVKFVSTTLAEYDLEITDWVSADYDRKTEGSYVFTGSFKELPDTIQNVYGIIPKITVNVVTISDQTPLKIFYDLALNINEADYTAESYEHLQIYVNNAADILSDRYAAENVITVASMQLSTALDALVNIKTDTSKLKEEVEKVKALQKADYDASYDIVAERLKSAEEVLKKPYSSQTDIDNALLMLSRSTGLLNSVNGNDVAALKAELTARCTELSKLDASLYSPKSYASLSAAVKFTSDALADDTVSYETLSAAKADLDASESSLIKLNDVAHEKTDVKAGLKAGGLTVVQVLLIVLSAVFLVGAGALGFVTFRKK